MNLDQVSKTVQVSSVVIGVVITVLSFSASRKAEAEARSAEAIKPFMELRQKTYTDAVKQAGILATPDGHTPAEINAAKLRFRELYVAELSMVESPAVESQMIELAKKLDPSLVNLTPPQTAAYNLAHALRNSYIASWGDQVGELLQREQLAATEKNEPH
jgi:hypothetical protein